MFNLWSLELYENDDNERVTKTRSSPSTPLCRGIKLEKSKLSNHGSADEGSSQLP